MHNFLGLKIIMWAFAKQGPVGPPCIAIRVYAESTIRGWHYKPSSIFATGKITNHWQLYAQGG